MSNTCCSNHTLACATVPKQEWCEPYDLKTALEKGTIFPCLDMEFFKGTDNITPISASALDSQAAALNEISMVGFAINDLTLYLDTHPDCKEGMKLFKELLAKRLELTGEPKSTAYDWAEAPLPWEGGHA